MRAPNSSRRSSPSSRPDRRSRRPSSAPARRAPSGRPTCRSPTIRRSRMRASSRSSARPKPTARQLVNLKGIPVMVMSAEASYHQVYDHCTAKYLSQAGVKTEHIRLQDKGIRGNGHMVMIEKNNLDIAHLIDNWVVQNVK